MDILFLISYFYSRSGQLMDRLRGYRNYCWLFRFPRDVSLTLHDRTMIVTSSRESFAPAGSLLNVIDMVISRTLSVRSGYWISACSLVALALGEIPHIRDDGGGEVRGCPIVDWLLLLLVRSLVEFGRTPPFVPPFSKA